MKARRDSSNKERPSLNVNMANKLTARRWTKGAEKYTIRNGHGEIVDDGTFNWKRGFDTTKILDSLERHLQAFKSGEDIDWDWSDELNKKYGLNTHLDGIIVNAQMLLDQYYRNMPDNRLKENYAPRIGLDLDGVLASTMNIEKADYRNYADYRFLREYKNWLENDEAIMNTSLTKEVFTMNFEPIAYITARPLSIRDQTLRWVEEKQLPAAPVIFTEDKVSACKEHKVELFVEDHYDNFCQLNAAGIKCLLIDRSYNRKYDVGHRRIYNLKLL